MDNLILNVSYIKNKIENLLNIKNIFSLKLIVKILVIFCLVGVTFLEQKKKGVKLIQ